MMFIKESVNLSLYPTPGAGHPRFVPSYCTPPASDLEGLLSLAQVDWVYVVWVATNSQGQSDGLQYSLILIRYMPSPVCQL